MSTDQTTTTGEAPADQNQGMPGIVLFVVMLALFVLGFWLMGQGAVQTSFGPGAALFGGGLLACAVAFAAPMSLRTR